MTERDEEHLTPCQRLAGLTLELLNIDGYLQKWRHFHRAGVFELPRPGVPDDIERLDYGPPLYADMSRLAFTGHWKLPKKFRSKFYRPVAHALGNFWELWNRAYSAEPAINAELELLPPSHAAEVQAAWHAVVSIVDFDVLDEVWFCVHNENLDPITCRRTAVNLIRERVKRADRICGPMLHRAAGLVWVTHFKVTPSSRARTDLDPGTVERVRNYIKSHDGKIKTTLLRSDLGIRNQTASDILKYLKERGEFFDE